MAVEEIVPIGNPEWECVWERHNSCYPNKDRTVESLKRKFQELAKKKVPTGDPNCPPHIIYAQRIYRKIVEATDGSTGGSDLKGDLEDYNDDKDVDGDEEDNGKDVVGNIEFLAGMDEDGDSNDHGEGGGRREHLVMARDLFLQKEGGNNSTAGDASASMSMQHSLSGAKRLSTQSSGGGRKKSSKGFTQPLWIPWRSSTLDKSGKGDGSDGYSFGNMMSMMMMQNRFDNKQRERQYQKELELREREFQLCWEEMAIACKEVHAQHQMVNIMLMTMLNKNGGGDNSNPPPSPSMGQTNRFDVSDVNYKTLVL